MRLKSYFAGTVESAMALASQELGPEAMLVHSRRASGDGRRLGEYEVVFADGVDGEGPALTGRTELARTPEQLSDELSELRRQIERMSANFVRSSFAGPGRLNDGAAQALSLLLDAGVGAEIAEELAGTELEGGWRQAAEQRIRFDATLGRPGKSRRIVALVGPPGGGKTTTLVKLAARYAVGGRKPGLFLSADSFRIAASDQLRSYATILGVGFQAAETAEALGLALDEHRHKELIFIDTPGLSMRDMGEGTSLAALIAGHAEIDVHLVAPASMRSADLARAIDRYGIFHPHKLLFTKLDETEYGGVLLNEAVRTRLPLSFVATGQEVPEDFEAATFPLLTSLCTRTARELTMRARA